jgi:hypothetical protein
MSELDKMLESGGVGSGMKSKLKNSSGQAISKSECI